MDLQQQCHTAAHCYFNGAPDISPPDWMEVKHSVNLTAQAGRSIVSWAVKLESAESVCDGKDSSAVCREISWTSCCCCYNRDRGRTLLLLLLETRQPDVTTSPERICSHHCWWQAPERENINKVPIYFMAIQSETWWSWMRTRYFMFSVYLLSPVRSRW